MEMNCPASDVVARNGKIEKKIHYYSSNVPNLFFRLEDPEFLGCSLKHRLLWQSCAAWRSSYCS
jgi:hypothetical protein